MAQQGPTLDPWRIAALDEGNIYHSAMASPSNTSSRARPLVAAFASALLPGLGQFIARDTRRGIRLMMINAGIFVVFAYVFLRDGLAPKEVILTAAVVWTRPTALAMMMVINIVLLGYRVWAADDAYRKAKNRSSGTTRATGQSLVFGAVVLGAFLLVPHAVFGYYDLVTYDTITTIFGTTSAQPTTTTTTENTPPVTDASGNTVVTTSPSTTTTQPPSNPFDDHDRLNILLIGGDFGAGRTGIRTDTMITVSIDPKTGEAAMFSVPRNWTQAPLPEGMGVWDCDCYPELINELWIAGVNYPDAFPGPGTPSENAVKGIIGEFLGIPIHYYAMVNLDGFVDIVDALGGVRIYVPTPVLDEKYPLEDGTGTERIEIDAGWQKFDGHLALAYARTRNQDSDYFRMNRQRCVIEAMMKQADPVSLVLNFGTLAEVIKNTMMTDIPLEALPQLIKLLPSVDIDNIVSVRFIPPDYHLKYRDDGRPGGIANIDLVREHVQLVINDPERAVRELGLEQLEDVCGEPSP